jgi:hypothetical protein
VDKLSQLYEKGLSRRNFLAGAGALGGAAVLVGCNDAMSTTTTTPPATSNTTYTDADILNFALNLEYLEAEFYLRAATGSGLTSADIGSSPGAVTPGSAAMVTGTTAAQQAIIAEIAYEEQQHVRFLRSALGSAAVSRPAIDLSFFGPLAVAAGITGATFNPFASFDAFLIGSFIFEDVGVTAYAGAAPLLTSASNLGAAAGIMAVEAYHAGYVRTALTARGIAAGSASAYPYIGIANQVEALRSTLSGGPSVVSETALTLPTNLTTASGIVPATSANAIAYARSTNQVLHIVYGSATVGVAKGGFFPNGINSTVFATTTA